MSAKGYLAFEVRSVFIVQYIVQCGSHSFGSLLSGCGGTTGAVVLRGTGGRRVRAAHAGVRAFRVPHLRGLERRRQRTRGAARGARALPNGRPLERRGWRPLAHSCWSLPAGWRELNVLSYFNKINVKFPLSHSERYLQTKIVKYLIVQDRDMILYTWNSSISCIVYTRTYTRNFIITW